MRNATSVRHIGSCLLTTVRIRDKYGSSNISHYRHFKDGIRVPSFDAISLNTTAYSVTISRDQYRAILRQLRRDRDSIVAVERIRVS